MTHIAEMKIKSKPRRWMHARMYRTSRHEPTHLLLSSKGPIYCITYLFLLRDENNLFVAIERPYFARYTEHDPR